MNEDLLNLSCNDAFCILSPLRSRSPYQAQSFFKYQINSCHSKIAGLGLHHMRKVTNGSMHRLHSAQQVDDECLAYPAFASQHLNHLFCANCSRIQSDITVRNGDDEPRHPTRSASAFAIYWLRTPWMMRIEVFDALL